MNELPIFIVTICSSVDYSYRKRIALEATNAWSAVHTAVSAMEEQPKVGGLWIGLEVKLADFSIL